MLRMLLNEAFYLLEQLRIALQPSYQDLSLFEGASCFMVSRVEHSN